MGYMFVLGACCCCGAQFSFAPTKVPSIRMRKTKTGFVADPSAPRQPICENCVKRANVKRQQIGMPPITILPGAYEAERCD